MYYCLHGSSASAHSDLSLWHSLFPPHAYPPYHLVIKVATSVMSLLQEDSTQIKYFLGLVPGEGERWMKIFWEPVG